VGLKPFGEASDGAWSAVNMFADLAVFRAAALMGARLSFRFFQPFEKLVTISAGEFCVMDMIDWHSLGRCPRVDAVSLDRNRIGF
jgi:hypothetical protein